MFLKDISTIICTILADEKNITVQQLYEKVTRRKVAVSLPNFYKIIARMLDEQVLVKKNNLLQLHGMRVQYAMMITDKIKLNYLQENNLNVEKLKS
jgi:phosphopentomutase